MLVNETAMAWKRPWPIVSFTPSMPLKEHRTTRQPSATSVDWQLNLSTSQIKVTCVYPVKTGQLVQQFHEGHRQANKAIVS